MSKAKWPPPLVVIHWVDSIATSSWASYDARRTDLDTPDQLTHRSCGYLVKSSPNYVAVTHSVGIGIKNVGDTIQIPRVAITRIETIVKAEATKKKDG